jgi:hypothetical protein
MKTLCINLKSAGVVAVLVLFFPLLSPAQLISIKSVPVADAEQFLTVPSQNLGMGGLSIALEDASLDPFINPAKGGRIKGAYLFSSPVFGNISDNNGSIRTLPLGALLGAEKWFGGMTLAVQQLSGPRAANGIRWNSQPLLADMNKHNMFAAGLLGTKFPAAGISLAASVSWAELQAMQGVEFLYRRSSRIEQSGHITDYRLGLFREKGRQPSFEMLLLHNRVRMAHDLYYQTWFWEGDVIATWWAPNVIRELDQTDTWGLHLGSMIPLRNPDSRAGLIFTVNRKSHPKIPNYELMNIPRDPGVSWAFNFGAGLSHATDSSALGMDLIFEPIWSQTWADAAEPVRNQRGEIIIPAGGKTVENYFRFNNALVRLGLRQQGKIAGFQLGLQARFINYRLKQTNFIAGTRRSQKEFWAEWTPSIGFNLNFPTFQIRYTGRVTAGTGQPGVAPSFGVRGGAADQSSAGNYIIAPSGDLTLQEAVVLTHQISVAVALRSVR